jgi:hypothetical protein
MLFMLSFVIFHFVGDHQSSIVDITNDKNEKSASPGPLKNASSCLLSTTHTQITSIAKSNHYVQQQMTIMGRTTQQLLRLAASRVLVIALTILLVLGVTQPVAGRCRAPPTIPELVDGVNGPKALIVRVTLLAGITKNISCPLTVHTNMTMESSVATAEGYGVLQVEEVFSNRGNTTTTSVGGVIAFVYSTDTGYQQELPMSVADAAVKFPEGILVFLTLDAPACADKNPNAVPAEDSIFVIGECDFGNGLPFDGSWANVSSADQVYLRSLSTAGSAPAAQPTISTLTPTSVPASHVMQSYNVLIATLIWAAVWVRS